MRIVRTCIVCGQGFARRVNRSAESKAHYCGCVCSNNDRKTLIPIDRQRMEALYAGGASDNDIGRALGVGEHVIRYRRRKWDLPALFARSTRVSNAELRRWYVDYGLSITLMASWLSAHRTTLSGRLQRLGVPIRTGNATTVRYPTGARRYVRGRGDECCADTELQRWYVDYRLSISLIAGWFHLRNSAIRRRLTRLGIPIRRGKEATPYFRVQGEAMCVVPGCREPCVRRGPKKQKRSRCLKHDREQCFIWHRAYLRREPGRGTLTHARWALKQARSQVRERLYGSNRYKERLT